MTVRKRPVGLFPNVSMFKDAASRVLRCDKLRPVDPDIPVLQALLGYERPAIVVNAGSVALVSWFAADRANGTAHPNLLHGKNPLPVVCFAKALLRAVLAAARLARGTLELVAATKAYTHVFSSLLIDVSTESALGGAVEAATMLTGMKLAVGASGGRRYCGRSENRTGAGLTAERAEYAERRPLDDLFVSARSAVSAVNS